MVENDEMARRLKLFVEKLEHDKTELYHQLQEEKKYVYSSFIIKYNQNNNTYIYIMIY